MLTAAAHLEAEGIVRRRELDPPATGIVYELTALGRGLERPILELARWGMELQKAEDVGRPGAVLAAERAAGDPAPARRRASFDLGLRSGGQSYALRARDGGRSTAWRGAASRSQDLGRQPAAPTGGATRPWRPSEGGEGGRRRSGATGRCSPGCGRVRAASRSSWREEALAATPALSGG